MDEQSAVAVQIPARAHAVGPGWQELLTRLHQQLCTLAPGYVLTGLKEKLGGLRVQVEAEGADRSALRGAAAAAEAESVRPCEFCGAPGGVRTRNDAPGGWRKTVCDPGYGAWSAHYLMIIHGAVRDRRR
ncbi:hypothetical protein [Streptomyces sp. NBC_00878]|uniref:hypothetical protein n=1 Tax=Streptomyces sp. NBC_00878 TaxID=2975854 RepID=UPI002253C39B|nr:hypothetical protein [Streptomyces sp. NBC_00878]MCX4911943.1 hypothetical protein [Streptomyces sp. NBC_00878]